MHRVNDMKGEMMNQIDRQAAIEALYSVDEYNPRSIKVIKDLPSAQSESKWIPCSERLPDVAQRVLLSGHGMVMIGMLHSFGKYSLEPTGISYVYPKDDIEAWMPMPEPYAGKRIEETDYERAVEQLEHDILYEPTFNQDDGSM